MNQKGFANIVLIILVVILAGALGYVTLVKKPAPVERPQTNNSQNTQPTTPSPSQQPNTNKETVEYHIAVQGNPTYKPVALSEVTNYSSTSVNNFVTTNGTVAFVDGRTDGTNFPRIVLMDDSGHYLVIPTAHAFYNEWGPMFSKLKIGDVVQVWGIATRLDVSPDVIKFQYPGINFDSPTVGGIDLTGIKKLSNSSPITPSASLPTSCVDQPQAKAVITSLSSYSGQVGTKLEIRGCNFSGFEDDKNVWIENSQGVKGFLYGEQGSTAKVIKVTLKSPLCQFNYSSTGRGCTAASVLYLTAGTYKIWTMPWGADTKSNIATFTVQ